MWFPIPARLRATRLCLANYRSSHCRNRQTWDSQARAPQASNKLTETRTADIATDNKRADRMLDLRARVSAIRVQMQGTRDIRTLRSQQLRLTNTDRKSV